MSIVDDHPVFAESIAVALELTGQLHPVSVSPDAESGFDALSTHRPDLAIIDYRLAGPTSGVGLCERIRSAGLQANGGPLPVLLLTGFPTPTLHASILRVGCAAVVSKASSISSVIAEARRCIDEGPASPDPLDDPFGLSPAETEVLQHLSAGRNAAQIARMLCLSVHAVRARIRGLLRKLDAGSQLEAVCRAMSYGLVAPPGRVSITSAGERNY